MDPHFKETVLELNKLHFVLCCSAPASNAAGMFCYESPKKEKVSRAFKHLTANIKSYNGDKI